MVQPFNEHDLRARRTRRDLYQAFMELGAEKEFSAITIQDIADRAEVNRGTFYKHFRDKYELLELTAASLLTDMLEKWIPAADDASELDEATVRRLLRVMSEWHAENRRCVRGYHPNLPASLDVKIKQQLERFILARLQHVPPAQRDILAVAMSWSMYGITLQWSEAKSGESIDSLIELALPVMLAPLRAALELA